MRTHVWIRVENEKRWNEIEDKSEWINSKLKEDKLSDVKQQMVNIEQEHKVMSTRLAMTPGMGFCKEGHPIPEGRDRCFRKGCKYS